MKRYRLLLLLVLPLCLLGLLLAGAGSTPSHSPKLKPPSQPPQPRPGEIWLSAEHHPDQVQLQPGEVLVIELETNPATGYGWEIGFLDTGLLQPLGEPEYFGQTGLLGAPYRQLWRFRPISAGISELSLVYQRPWDDEVNLTQSFQVTVENQGDFSAGIPANRLLAYAQVSGLRQADLPFSPMSAPGEQLTATLVPPAAVQDLPTAFDWCSSMGGCTPVKNQGNCGSCWAFSTVGPFELGIKIADGVVRDLSEQYLLSCNDQGYSCDGGWFVHKYHQNYIPAGESAAGARYEADFPYVAAKVACNPPHPAYEKISSWSYVNPSDPYSVPSAALIKQAIYDHGPVAASVCVGNAFQNYTGGIFTTDEASSCGANEVNHGIVLVGWGYDATKGEYWILRNSWGTYWGESNPPGGSPKGYMRIKIGISNVGYGANYVVYTSGSVTRTPTATGTATRTATATSTATRTATSTSTATRTATATSTSTSTPTVTGTPPTQTPTPTATETNPPPSGILLVDDDDNSPDVRSYYTTALDSLGAIYDVWNTAYSDNEPDAATLSGYTAVIWFSGDSWINETAGPGPAGESALATWLNGGGCLLISSQDYYYSHGLTSFMQDYLGVSAVDNDISQTQVTGLGTVFGGLGTLSLSYPFINFSDRFTLAAAAETAFLGNQGIAAVDKYGLGYKTTYWGFPLEALPNASARLQALQTFLNWCGSFSSYIPLTIK